MKNKKGAKQQRFIQQVQHQVKNGGNAKKTDDPTLKKLEKEKKLQEQKEMNLLFRPVATQKIEKGINIFWFLVRNTAIPHMVRLRSVRIHYITIYPYDRQRLELTPSHRLPRYITFSCSRPASTDTFNS